MEHVGTAVLKNKLSTYLHKVRKGARVIVTDHGKPVAKIVPIDSKDAQTDEEKLAAWAAEGGIELPRSKKPFKVHKKIDLGGDFASQYIIEDREKGW